MREFRHWLRELETPYGTNWIDRNPRRALVVLLAGLGVEVALVWASFTWLSH